MNLIFENVEVYNRDMFEINLVINSFVRKKKEGWKGRVKFEFKIVNLEIDGEKNR